MFRIEAFVEDKNLAAFLRAAAGMLRGMELKPVVELPTGSGVIAAQPRSNGYMELFADYLATHSNESVNPDFAKKFLMSIGRTPASHQHVLRSAVSMKYVRKIGTVATGIKYVNLVAKNLAKNVETLKEKE